MTHLIESYGVGLLFVLVMLESAGIPLPGETALIAAGILASQRHLSIASVVVAAAAAAIVGDNLGYWVARIWGRRLLEHPYLRRYGDRVLPPAERFFERHGAKTVFIGRFVAILRFTAAWLAGLARMPWWRFLVWNAAGGICWAVLVGLVAYYLGRAAADAINHYGLIAGGAIVGLVVLGFLGLHLWRRRLEQEA